MGLFPYEIYTLMCARAGSLKFKYDFKIHTKLMDLYHEKNK